MKRRQLLLWTIAAGTAGLALGRAQAASQVIRVYKTPTCGCCGGWVDHLRGHGFTVQVNEVDDTAPWRQRAGIAPALGSCHTAFVGRYALEGHVPASDIRRLLAEQPTARGLAVPGMEPTSPGMGEDHGPGWNVLLVAEDGSTRVFHAYPAR